MYVALNVYLIAPEVIEKSLKVGCVLELKVHASANSNKFPFFYSCKIADVLPCSYRVILQNTFTIRKSESGSFSVTDCKILLQNCHAEYTADVLKLKTIYPTGIEMVPFYRLSVHEKSVQLCTQYRRNLYNSMQIYCSFIGCKINYLLKVFGNNIAYLPN